MTSHEGQRSWPESYGEPMSENIEQGCTCSRGGLHSPCHWCTSLTQTEVDLLDTYGIEILRWLQTHYLLYNGEWNKDEQEGEVAGEETTSLSEFINASIILAQDDINLRKGKFTDAFMAESSTRELTLEDKLSTLRIIEEKMKSSPPPNVISFRDGTTLVKAALPSAEIYNLAHYRKERKLGPASTP